MRSSSYTLLIIHFTTMVLDTIFQRCHARMFPKVSAEKRGVGEIQFIGNLLHRHIGEAQAALDGLHREKLYHVARPAVHSFLENG